MSRTYTGARRKRTNTPALNRRRAVAYRHSKYAHKRILPDTEIPAVSLDEDLAVRKEQKIEEPVSSSSAAEEPRRNVFSGFLSKAAALFTTAKNSILNLIEPVDEETEEQLLAQEEELSEAEITSLPEETDEAEESVAEEAEAETSEEEHSEHHVMEEIKEEASVLAGKGAAALTALKDKVADLLPHDKNETESAETEDSAERAISDEVNEEESVSAEAETSESIETQEEAEITSLPEETQDSAESTIPAEENGEETVSEEETETSASEETQTEAEITSITEETSGSEETEDSIERTVSSEENEAEETEAAEAEEEHPEHHVMEEIKEEASILADKGAAALTALKDKIADILPHEKNETEAVEDPAEENAEETEPSESQETQEEAPVEETEEKPALTRWESLKQKRTAHKNQVLDDIIDTPRSSILQMLVRPGLAMEKSGSVDYPVLSQAAVFFLNVFKWIAFGLYPARLISALINTYSFSIARINFTGTAGLAFRIGIFGLAAEYFSYILISTACGLMRQEVSFCKITDTQSRSAAAVGALFVIASVLTDYHMSLAFAVFAAGCVVGLLLKDFGFNLVLKDISKTKQLVLIVICTMLCAFAALFYFRFVSGDIVRIFKTILNI